MFNVSLQAATDLVAAGAQHATELKVPSTITVVDAAGYVVAVGRMEGALLISIDASAAKARTCVFFGGTPSGDLAAAVQPGAPLYGIGIATGQHLAFVAGGVPLLKDGMLIGAVGSGGGMPDQDEQVARAAVAAVSL